jgi:hypothetical protein
VTILLDCKSNHRRFTSYSGTLQCETCTEMAAGWRDCKDFTCTTLVPPEDGVFCPTHKPVDGPSLQCPQCKGDGVVDCDEFECHGEFCDLGEVDCGECDGTGLVKAIAA